MLSKANGVYLVVLMEFSLSSFVDYTKPEIDTERDEVSLMLQILDASSPAFLHHACCGAVSIAIP